MPSVGCGKQKAQWNWSGLNLDCARFDSLSSQSTVLGKGTLTKVPARTHLHKNHCSTKKMKCAWNFTETAISGLVRHDVLIHLTKKRDEAANHTGPKSHIVWWFTLLLLKGSYYIYIYTPILQITQLFILCSELRYLSYTPFCE